jgi:hypothetical protein
MTNRGGPRFRRDDDPLAFREKLTIMPPSLFYQRRIAGETRSGEPELFFETIPRVGI